MGQLVHFDRFLKILCFIVEIQMTQQSNFMSLQKKVSLTLLAVVAVFTVLSFAVLHTVIAPAFDDIEGKAAATDLVRAEGAMQTNLDNLSTITLDWASWDDIFYYVRGDNPGFKKSNLDRSTLDNLDLDFMAVFSNDGDALWSQVFADGEEVHISALDILNADHPYSPLLVRHDESTSLTLGIVRTGLGPALINSRPIVRSDNSGPVSGALVMGQFLSDSRLQRVRDRTEVAVSWLFTDSPGDVGPNTALLALGAGESRADISDTEIRSYKIFPDILGKPLLIVQTATPRQISELGSRTVNAGLVFLVVAGCLVTVVMWFLLSRMILGPLNALASHISRIRESGNLAQRSGLGSRGEIGALAMQFDNLTAEVHDTRQALLDQSFKAGKADTAAEVLHNIRNAMTPMINGLDRLARAFNVTGSLRATEAIEQLASPDCPLERQQKILEYLDASFRHIEDTNADAAEDLKIVASQARQVEAILADQERFANVAPVTEKLSVDDVVSEAAHVIPKNAKPQVSVSMDERLHSYAVRAHKSGLLQVLGNLMLNAFESIQRAGKDAGQIVLQASNDTLNDKPMIRVTVRDNGRGFNKEVGKRIFQRGFTSKKDGETNGLGLHWCANAVAGMGGRIFAESPGDGQGAEFHVLLPAAQGGQT